MTFDVLTFYLEKIVWYKKYQSQQNMPLEIFDPTKFWVRKQRQQTDIIFPESLTDFLKERSDVFKSPPNIDKRHVLEYKWHK